MHYLSTSTTSDATRTNDKQLKLAVYFDFGNMKNIVHEHELQCRPMLKDRIGKRCKNFHDKTRSIVFFYTHQKRNSTQKAMRMNQV